jgi:nucleoside-diphosphate-sugar epimerase
MRALLTGATGFIGSHVARTLLARRDEVHALSRPDSSRWRLSDVEDRISWHEPGPTDGELRATIEAIGPDVAIHLAWYAEPGRYLDAAPENLQSLAGAVRLFDALVASGCRHVVLGGTCLENRPATTIYAATKAAMHQVAEHLGAAGLASTCAHIFYPYGPGEDQRRAVPSVINALLRGHPIAVGDGPQERDYLHVADVATALCALVDGSAPPSVDICTGQTTPVREVFEMIGIKTGHPELIRFGELAPDDRGFPSTGDPSPLAHRGWRPNFDLSAGLDDSIQYWRGQQRRSA